MPQEKLAEQGSRLICYDFVRVMAMVMVVAVHATGALDTRGPIVTWYHNFAQALFFSANAIFFMMSGKFNLTERSYERPSLFYSKKFRGIILPVLVIFLLRTLFDLWPEWGSVAHVAKVYVKNLLGEFSSTEYWFIFSLVSFLLVAPILSLATGGMSLTMKWGFYFGGLAWLFVRFVTANMGIMFSWSFLFSGFLFTFFIGPFVEELFSSRRARRLLYGVSLVCLVVTVLLFREGYRDGIHDNSPFYMLYSVGIYLLLISLGGRIRSQRLGRVIAFVARHSFTVYLIHIAVRRISYDVFPAFEGTASILGSWLVTMWVLVVSLVLSVVIDAALIRPLQRGYDRLCRFIAAARLDRDGMAHL